MEILERYKQYREANNKSNNTVLNEQTRLIKLVNDSDKHFKDINEQDTMKYLKQLSLGSKTQYSTTIINFFKWYLDTKERPKCMKWFEYPSKDLLVQKSDPDREKHLITDEEYAKIIQYTKRTPKWSALYETLYLSGGRRDEVNNMKFKDVSRLVTEGIITLRKSKTIPRTIALNGNPEQLIRWIEQHPTQNPNDPLFPSDARTNSCGQMLSVSINKNFEVLKNKLDIKQALTPHSFRKTRATIMFSSRNPTYDDSEIAKYFGWKPHTVVERREQYDLRTEKDLQKKVRGAQPKIQDFDTVKAERDTVVNKLMKQMEAMREEINILKYEKETGIDVFPDKQ